MELIKLGQTDMWVSPLGLGTVKLGRNEQVKYPKAFQIPDDKAVVALLSLAADLGINLLDTAPAYGTSQMRLGKLLPGTRDQWVIVSKVGEIFENGQSRFDFSYDGIIRSVENSCRQLNTDYIDAVLLHSDGNDMDILEHTDAVPALAVLKQKGLIRAHGMSSKTVEGGIKTLENMDMVMASCNLEYTDEFPVFEFAGQQGKAVLVKKALASGHIQSPDAVAQSMEFVLSQPGVSSMMIGTINPDHLRSNVAAVEAALSC